MFDIHRVDVRDSCDYQRTTFVVTESRTPKNGPVPSYEPDTRPTRSSKSSIVGIFVVSGLTIYLWGSLRSGQPTLSRLLPERDGGSSGVILNRGQRVSPLTELLYRK